MTSEDASASRWSRTIYAPDGPLVDGTEADDTVCAFAGVFGDQWVDNLVESLERQNIGPLQCVLAINGPNERALNRLLDFQRRTHHHVTVVVNERNLGPLGSWYRNRDLLLRPWIAFFHQDDVYLDDHVLTLKRMAGNANQGTVGLFTSLGDLQGGDHGAGTSAPMANRHLRLKSPQVLVPEIVRRHPFPTPTFALRAAVDVADMAWYDSGAPDSEWFARLACQGSLDSSDEVTVLYRRPLDSESSKTDWKTRAWLWSLSLSRLLTSREFRHLLVDLPPGERDKFARRMLQAIPARYPSSPIFTYLQFLAAQEMATAWDYGDGESGPWLLDALSAWGHSASTISLQSLTGKKHPTPHAAPVDALLGDPIRRAAWDRAGRRAFTKVGHRLPRTLQERIVRAYGSWRRGSS
jgi:hypothetical protein